ncbi:MAG: twin-arginine translocase TatA/TatE family subunit [Legionellales bacterium]|nr:twin-arginine translocase TatA/TatE family subunit [Legionellales bacterium]
MSGIGPGSLIVILVIVVLLFGTKRLRSLGKDLGIGVKSFKKGLHDDDNESDNPKPSGD